VALIEDTPKQPSDTAKNGALTATDLYEDPMALVFLFTKRTSIFISSTTKSSHPSYRRISSKRIVSWLACAISLSYCASTAPGGTVAGSTTPVGLCRRGATLRSGQPHRTDVPVRLRQRIHSIVSDLDISRQSLAILRPASEAPTGRFALGVLTMSFSYLVLGGGRRFKTDDA